MATLDNVKNAAEYLTNATQTDPRDLNIASSMRVTW